MHAGRPRTQGSARLERITCPYRTRSRAAAAVLGPIPACLWCGTVEQCRNGKRRRGLDSPCPARRFAVTSMINNGAGKVPSLGGGPTRVVPGLVTQTGLRADLRSTWPQGVTERAVVRLVIEPRYGREDDHARFGDFQSRLGTTVQQQSAATTAHDTDPM
jgi:hypothetical protein